MDHVYQMVYTHPVKNIWGVTNFNKNAILVTKDLRMGQINSQSQTIFKPLVLGVPFSNSILQVQTFYNYTIPYFPQDCVLSLASCFE